MSSDADLLADRRSLRRKLTLWRVLAVLGVVAMTASLIWQLLTSPLPHNVSAAGQISLQRG